MALAPWVLGLFFLKFAFTLQSYGVRTYATSYVTVSTGTTVATANAVFAAFIAGGALATLLFGSLADRYERHSLIAVAFLVASGAIAATALLPPQVVVLLPWFFLLGTTVYATLPVVNALVAEYAEHGFSGGLFGIVQTASALGGVVGPAAFGALAARTGMEYAYPAIAVVPLAAGVVMLILLRRVE